MKALPVTRKAIEEESRKDENVLQVIWMLHTETWPSKPIKSTTGRIVVPTSLQEVVLKQLHEGHPGMARMNMLACQEAAKAPKYTVVNFWITEKKPWDKIHIDYAKLLNGRIYPGCRCVLEVPRSLRDVVVVYNCNVERTQIVVRTIPRVIVSDNGMQFTAKKFLEFYDRQGIEHIRSPPFHPQSNDRVERFVNVLK
ncbi:hypothetical protein RB195_018382 [Necator americanus]|uniref:Integrase catalytic domain-containing protein n=1 Tax=Necator americanus TaxID=51031 RepID=A0ABR1CD63_NECAM